MARVKNSVIKSFFYTYSTAHFILQFSSGEDQLNWDIQLNIGDVAGDLWFNITADNLHSDPDYGAVGEISHGSCLIHVQKPINFLNTTSSKEHHIIGITEPDGGKLYFEVNYRGTGTM